MTLAATTLTASVKALALELGFDLVTIGPCEPPEHGAAFRRWVEAGHAGTMGYLERRVEERLDPQRVLPGARSIIVAARSYLADGEPARPGGAQARVAREDWGGP